MFINVILIKEMNSGVVLFFHYFIINIKIVTYGVKALCSNRKKSIKDLKNEEEKNEFEKQTLHRDCSH